MSSRAFTGPLVALLLGLLLPAQALAQGGSRPRPVTQRPSNNSGYNGPTGSSPPSVPNTNPVPNTPPDPDPTPPPTGGNRPTGRNRPHRPHPLPVGPGGFGTPPRLPAGGAPPKGDPRGGRPRKRKSDKLGGATPLGLPFAVDSWENWWTYNDDRYLQIDRSYRTRARVSEPSRDEFLGTEDVEDPASPVGFHRRRVLKDLLPALIERTEHPSSMVRGEAALALGKVGDRRVVPRLVTLSRDRNRFVRQMALLGLGSTRSRRAVSPLMAFLIRKQNQDADRAHAALALGMIGDPMALTALGSVLLESGREHNLTGAALYAMGFLPTDDAGVQLEEFLSDRGARGSIRAAAVSALGKRGDRRLVPFLLERLRDSQTHVRRSATLALGAQKFVSPLWQRRDDLLRKIKHWTDTEILSAGARRALEEQLAEIERDAIRETQDLHRLQDKVTLALKRRMERDGDLMVRNFAAMAMGRIGGDAARVALDRELRTASGSQSHRGFVALALGIGGGRESLRHLRGLAGDSRSNPSTRGAASLTLGLLRDRASGQGLMDMALSHTNVVRAFAAVGCGLMNFRPARDPFRQELLDEAQAFLRPTFGLALGLLGDHRSIEFLENLITQRRSGNTRIQAAQALGRIRDLGSSQVLAQVIRRKDLTDLELANFCNAAGHVAEKGALPVVEPLARDWNYLLDFPVVNLALQR